MDNNSFALALPENKLKSHSAHLPDRKIADYSNDILHPADQTEKQTPRFSEPSTFELPMWKSGPKILVNSIIILVNNDQVVFLKGQNARCLPRDEEAAEEEEVGGERRDERVARDEVWDERAPEDHKGVGHRQHQEEREDEEEEGAGLRGHADHPAQ
jgi:hypothetical protein